MAGPVEGDGCEHSPSCFTCPLPECKYEARKHDPTLVQRNRDIRILRRRYGVPVKKIAQHFGLSDSTVFHLLREGEPT